METNPLTLEAHNFRGIIWGDNLEFNLRRVITTWSLCIVQIWEVMDKEIVTVEDI